MDFLVTIDGSEFRFEQYQDMLSFLQEKLAYWNNFQSDQEYTVVFRKIPSQTETVGVNVKDEWKAFERFS